MSKATTAPLAPQHAERRRGARRWQRWTAAVGLVLLLVPVLALLATHRTPDAVFLGFWWSPIASVPTDTLTIGSIGLLLLLASALPAALTRPLRAQRRATAVGLVLAIAVIAAVTGLYTAAAAARTDSSYSTIRAVLLHQTPPEPVTGQARRAIELALGWPTPTPTPDGIHLRDRSTVPAGPWLLQTTEVLNENTSDEGSDVTVETLINPITGTIEAAWFYGL